MLKYSTSKRIGYVMDIIIQGIAIFLVVFLILYAIRRVNYWRTNIDSNDNYYMAHSVDTYKHVVKDARVVMISHDEL
ncbi:MAG: hypothetical protein RSF81_06955, partial [Oscillospiraceae bacterium]